MSCLTNVLLIFAIITTAFLVYDPNVVHRCSCMSISRQSRLSLSLSNNNNNKVNKSNSTSIIKLNIESIRIFLANLTKYNSSNRRSRRKRSDAQSFDFHQFSNSSRSGSLLHRSRHRRRLRHSQRNKTKTMVNIVDPENISKVNRNRPNHSTTAVNDLKCLPVTANMSARLHNLARSFNTSENRSLVLFLSVIVLALMLLFYHYFYNVHGCSINETVKQLNDNLKLAGVVPMDQYDKEKYFYLQLRRQLKYQLPERCDSPVVGPERTPKRTPNRPKSSSSSIKAKSVPGISFPGCCACPLFADTKNSMPDRYSYSGECSTDNTPNTSSKTGSSATKTTTNQSTIIDSILKRFRTESSELNNFRKSPSCKTLSSMSLKQLEIS